MLCSIKELDGYAIAARDGDIGQVREVYFDDERWVIRHLVVATGGWLAGRDVLISPHAIEHLDREARRLEVNLSRRQIEDAPGIDTDQPVSRQQEGAYYDHYGYPYYWAGAGLWGAGTYPMGAWAMAAPRRDDALPEATAPGARAGRAAGDAHLRSSKKVLGCHIEARDGSIGHIDDFLFDEHSWAIRCAVVDTRNWLPDRLVLVPAQKIESIDWSAGKLRVELTRAAVESSPAYERSTPLSHDEDERIQRHFSGWA